MQREEVDGTESAKRQDVKEQRCEGQADPGVRAAAARHPLAPGWALLAPRALGGEGVASRVLEVQGSQWSRGLCTAPAGKEEPGKLKMCVWGSL